ncbi:hypothetical protein OG533_16120 [Streptomyces sp. NBC_01186]|uniref:hypothetical protein n=1 Tax=unclassified Streptomyces TaxID=2593676 RepID=UPI002DDC6310|nr:MULTISPECIES: hypothetical protein [unclassified Streptomyces]WSB78555.1 hypothetical protein OHB04_24130 [Streptomyces sp. NBC_01775]WSS13246.1 hypothetical protein OG533_16120 [Streptomyces sp. NBC_01186]
MDREGLDRLLAVEGSEAAEAARAALRDGGHFVVRDGAVPARSLARVYERRLRHTRRTGQETLGLEEAVTRLAEEYDRSVALGQISTSHHFWAFMLFFTEHAQALVACTGVRLPTPTSGPEPGNHAALGGN